jgi:hypothetical protein
MKDSGKSDPWLVCAVVVSFFEREGLAHKSHPPVKGIDSCPVTSSTNGISIPAAFALEYTSLADDPLAIKQSPSSATH